MHSQKNIKVFYPNYFTGKAISYACLSIAKCMQAPDTAVSVMGVSSDKQARNDFYHDAIPPILKKLAYKFVTHQKLNSYAEKRFCDTLKKGDIAYLWPGTSLDLYRKCKELGCYVVTENINTHQVTSKLILDAEYNRLGLPVTHGVTAEGINHENSILRYADCVFSPSPSVKQSLIENGFDEKRIIQTSYGLREDEILPSSLRQGKRRKLKAIFVGRICVRKGVHLLLEAWEASGTDAELLLVGNISEDIRYYVTPFLKRENITHMPYVNDLKPIYRDADFFILPSLEEGSPLVTYLALGAGLPSIVSEMGGGGVINDEKEGIVLDPHDKRTFIAAIDRIINDDQFRMGLAVAAQKKAPEFFWTRVGKQRKNKLFDKIYG